MKLLRYLIAALMVVIASSSMTVAATLGDLERQLKEIQTQIEGLKLEKQEQDRRVKEIEAAQKEKAVKEAEAQQEQAKRREEQERKTGILAEEMETLKSKFTLPETVEYKSLYGLGPAASKVYQMPRGLSIGGYGEASAIFFVGDNEGPSKRSNVGDLVRFVTYIGYKFSDGIILNSEIEYEHAKVASTVSAGAGDVEIEFATLDFLLTEQANIRTGLVLMPMGFLNEIHEPPFYFGNLRPEVEQRIIPTTWRELGVGLHGTILPGLTYRTYVTNSLNANGFSKTNIRAARQSGNRALFEDLAWTARLDYTPMPVLQVGGSVFWGNTGQDQLFAGKKIDANLTLFEFHGQYQYRGLQLRALFAQGHIGDADVLSAALGANGPISSRIVGGYAEVGYDILPVLFPGTDMSLSPFLRFERLDTQADVPAGFTPDRSRDIRVINAGLSFKPIPNVVIKADYRNLDAEVGQIADEFNIGFGFIF
ncbi:MAG TPA: DUF4200 domain-containing protein [Candidatus Methylomirabilis sp.]|nr:DUF4200 domain-containing protein [Candidatus Methylomirabilis sp.]